MDLEEILKKTKKKVERVIPIRQLPSIATADRPYETHPLSNDTFSKVATLKVDNLRKNRTQTGHKIRLKLI